MTHTYFQHWLTIRRCLTARWDIRERAGKQDDSVNTKEVNAKTSSSKFVNCKLDYDNVEYTLHDP